MTVMERSNACLAMGGSVGQATTGLHRTLVTEELRAQLSALPADRAADLSKLDPGDGHDTILNQTPATFPLDVGMR